MRFIFVLALCGIAATAHGRDYKDHGAICQAIEDNTKSWTGGGKAQFRAVCPCEIAQIEKTMEPALYQATVEWRIDPSGLVKNPPEGIKLGSFMGDAMPLWMAATQACK